MSWTPEQWPASLREGDLRRMKAMGLDHVCIGEGIWPLIEPQPHVFRFDALDGVFQSLEAQGMRSMLLLPLTAPPRWLDAGPSDETPRCAWTVLAAGAETIAQALAERYAPQVDAFLIPDGIGPLRDAHGVDAAATCSCPACADAFREWLRTQHTSIETLDETWGGLAAGAAFDGFDQIAPPTRVPGASAAHRIDFLRFARARAAALIARIGEIVRASAPGRRVLRRALGVPTRAVPPDVFDGSACDIAPLPFTTQLGIDAPARTGHADAAAFLHDLQRGAAGGAWHVLALQCGAVEETHRTVLPSPGLVRLWSWEAIAHGAETVSYARWRQAPAGDHMGHSGLLRADGEPAEGHADAARVARELAFVRFGQTRAATVALIHDPEAAWVFALQPHGETPPYLRLAFIFYQALRRLGLDVDVVGPHEVPSHRLVVAPSLPIWRLPRSRFLTARQAMVVGPRTASRTGHLAVDTQGVGDGRARLRAVRFEVLAAALQDEVVWEGRRYPAGPWREWVEGDTLPVARFENGDGAVHEADDLHWIAFWPSVAFLVDYLEALCTRLGIETQRLPDALRLRRRGDLTFAVNYGAEKVDVPAPDDAAFLLGSRDVTGHSVTAWRRPARDG